MVEDQINRQSLDLKTKLDIAEKKLQTSNVKTRNSNIGQGLKTEQPRNQQQQKEKPKLNADPQYKPVSTERRHKSGIGSGV
jgi:hypothetical protein